MTAEASSALRAAAMARYVMRQLRPEVPFDDRVAVRIVDGIPALREEIREAAGGSSGGDQLLKLLSSAHRWMGLSSTYLCPLGRVIEIEHHVAVFADGTILDPSADAHGEGFDVRVLRPSDPDYGRYRPEFDDDWNPGNDPIRLGGWSFDWIGLGDLEARDALRDARGYGWWVEDPALLTAFLRDQRSRASEAGDATIAIEIAQHLQALDARAHRPVFAPGSYQA